MHSGPGTGPARARRPRNRRDRDRPADHDRSGIARAERPWYSVPGKARPGTGGRGVRDREGAASRKTAADRRAPDPANVMVAGAGMQAKLHHWAAADPRPRFDDLFDFVLDPATLTVAFDRVAGNRGANSPGVNGLTAADTGGHRLPGFLDGLRAALKAARSGRCRCGNARSAKPGRVPRRSTAPLPRSRTGSSRRR